MVQMTAGGGHADPAAHSTVPTARRTAGAPFRGNPVLCPADESCSCFVHVSRRASSRNRPALLDFWRVAGGGEGAGPGAWDGRTAGRPDLAQDQPRGNPGAGAGGAARRRHAAARARAVFRAVCRTIHEAVRGVAGRGLAPQAGPGSAPTLRLPRRFGWLLPLVPHEAATYAGQVQGLLADPEMVAMIEAAPGLTRAFQPLCHMLGVDFGRRKPAARRAGPGREDTAPTAEGDAAPGLEKQGDAPPGWAAWPNGVPADVWLRFPDSHWLSPEQDGSGGGRDEARDQRAGPLEVGAAGVRRGA